MSELRVEQVLEARRSFQVAVLSFDASRAYGNTTPLADYVRLRITNNSSKTLPYLTVRTNRYGKDGQLIGWGRAPAIPTNNLHPGASVELDYYPLGHFHPAIAVVHGMSVDVEPEIEAEEMQFFKELVAVGVSPPASTNAVSAAPDLFDEQSIEELRAYIKKVEDGHAPAESGGAAMLKIKALEIQRSLATQGTFVELKDGGADNKTLEFHASDLSDENILLLKSPTALSRLGAWGFHKLVLVDPHGNVQTFDL